MRVLSLVHEPGPTGGGGTFEARALARGEDLTVCLTPDEPLPTDAAQFDAIMVFGGAMHPDQDAEHPWLSAETSFLRNALDQRVPMLGVCLGSQLIARAVGSWVGPGPVGEVGWCDVDLTAEGRDDPVIGAAFPDRFEAFQWHYYTWDLPDRATLLASNGAAKQAYRYGDRTWAVQFHPEVNDVMLDHWCHEGAAELPVSEAEIRAENAQKLPKWMGQGNALVDAFLNRAGELGPAAR